MAIRTLAAVALVSAGLASGTARAEPELAACPLPEDAAERMRAAPLPVPARLAGVLKADLLRYAVATRDGGTVCLDTSWMEEVERLALSPDGRLLSFDWIGYEAYGHVVVDRAGKGTVIETGAAPVLSPSGGLLAAVEYTEAGFGSLNGLGIWEMTAEALREVALIEFEGELTDWRMEGWSGNSCIRLSAIPFAVLIEQSARTKGPVRKAFAARSGKDGWAVSEGTCPSG